MRAALCLSTLKISGSLEVVPELVERNFGEFELQPDSNYQKVWEADAASLESTPSGGGESVTQVDSITFRHVHCMPSFHTFLHASCHV